MLWTKKHPEVNCNGCGFMFRWDHSAGINSDFVIQPVRSEIPPNDRENPDQLTRANARCFFARDELQSADLSRKHRCPEYSSFIPGMTPEERWRVRESDRQSATNLKFRWVELTFVAVSLTVLLVTTFST